MPSDKELVTLENLGAGAVTELFNLELQRVLDCLRHGLHALAWEQALHN